MKRTGSKLLFHQARGEWRQWQVAAQMGISEQTLIRWLRFDLKPDQAARVLRAIEELDAVNTTPMRSHTVEHQLKIQKNMKEQIEQQAMQAQPQKGESGSSPPPTVCKKK